jgi:hypothetical protein
MKKIIVIVFGILIAGFTYSQEVGYDEVTDSISGITGDWEVFYPKIGNIGDCSGHTVAITLVIKNTDAITDTFNIGGYLSDISYDYGVKHFETIANSALPYVIDTTDVTPTSTGIALCENTAGTVYAYAKTIYLNNFPFKYPAVKITKWALTQGDFTVYFRNIIE